MGSSIFDYFLLIANCVYILCYAVRDVLLLRILAVLAMLIMLPYYLFHPNLGVQLQCVLWQGVFIFINAFWIVLIYRERRPPVMTAEQKHLYETVFSGSCTANNMLKLLSVAEWKEAALGTKLIQNGTDLDELILIHQGLARVEVDGQKVAQLGAGDLVGEMSYLTSGKTVADVICNGPIKYISWSRDSLQRLFETNLELKSAIHVIIGRDLVDKLTSTQPSIPELSGDFPSVGG